MLLLHLAIQSMAVFATVCLVVSCATAIFFPGLKRLAQSLSVSAQPTFWIVLSALPILTATALLIITFLPAVGIGSDHCLTHEQHHPHLCPNHGTSNISLLVMMLSGAAILGATFAAIRFVQNQLMLRSTRRKLEQASTTRGQFWVFQDHEPQAFVLGTWRPAIFVSSGLLSLGEDVTETVLAHENIHVRRHDQLWRSLLPLLGVGHIPFVLARLQTRHSIAQELAVDAEVSSTLEDGRYKVASSLLAVAKRTHKTGPDITVRAAALVAQDDRHGQSGAVLIMTALLLTVSMLFAYEQVHHSVEGFLGLLT